MELHQLRYFTAVADLGSFTRAAEKCLVAQPSLSQQIIKLEKELGQPLFERLGRSVRLTAAGKLLKERVDQVLALLDDAQARITDDPDAGKLSIAAIPSIAPYYLPGVLEGFRRAVPGAQLEVVEEVTQVSLRKLAEGEVDLALLALAHELLQPRLEVRVRAAAGPRGGGVLQGLDRQVDLAVLLDGDDLRLDDVGLAEMVVDILDVVPVDLGDVHEPDLAALEREERPVRRDARHGPVDDRFHLELAPDLAERGPRPQPPDRIRRPVSIRDYSKRPAISRAPLPASSGGRISAPPYSCGPLRGRLRAPSPAGRP